MHCYFSVKFNWIISFKDFFTFCMDRRDELSLSFWSCVIYFKILDCSLILYNSRFIILADLTFVSDPRKSGSDKRQPVDTDSAAFCPSCSAAVVLVFWGSTGLETDLTHNEDQKLHFELKNSHFVFFTDSHNLHLSAPVFSPSFAVPFVWVSVMQRV